MTAYDTPLPSRRAIIAAAAAAAWPAEPARGQDPPQVTLTPQSFGATGDGRTDDAAAFQRAVDAALGGGRSLFVPAGRYRIGRPIAVRATPATNDSFASGLRLSGAGPGAAILEAMFSGQPLFDLDVVASAQFRASLGSLVEGLSLRGGGIRIRRAYHVRLRDLHIAEVDGTGIEIVCRDGDPDGPNMIALDQVRLDDCTGWGIDAAAAPGHNEISFLSLDQVFVQRCGRRSVASAPSSGGMKWKGQICTLRQCAFTLNENAGLYIPGEAGLAQSIDIESTAFENNPGRHALVTGISQFKARNIQLYGNDHFPAAVGCDFSGVSHAIRMVDIDGVTVRASSANRPFTAFRILGTHAETERCRVRNVSWEDFDHPGQVRFEGFMFDHVTQACRLRVIGPSEIVFGPDPRGGGNRTPLRLGGANSATGEWVEAVVASSIALPTEGLGADRRYAVYLFDDWNHKKLEASTVEPVLDPASGYRVKAGNAAHLHVGWLQALGNGHFAVED